MGRVGGYFKSGVFVFVIAFYSLSSVNMCYALAFPGLSTTTLGAEWHESAHGETAAGYTSYTDTSFTISKSMDKNNDGYVTVYADIYDNYRINYRDIGNCILSVEVSPYNAWYIVSLPDSSLILDGSLTDHKLLKFVVGDTYILGGTFFIDALPTFSVIDSTQYYNFCYDVYATTSLEFTSAEVPEPSTFLLFGIGLAGICYFRKKPEVTDS